MTTDHDAETHADMEGTFDLGSRLARSVTRGILVGLPIAYVGLVAALWLMTGRDFQRTLETAILPAALVGVFFGGFAGMASTLLTVERLERAHRRSGK